MLGSRQALLEERGHRVVTPTLSGMGERYREISRKATIEDHVGDRGWRVSSLDCGHDIMIDCPELLSEIVSTNVTQQIRIASQQFPAEPRTSGRRRGPSVIATAAAAS